MPNPIELGRAVVDAVKDASEVFASEVTLTNSNIRKMLEIHASPAAALDPTERFEIIQFHKLPQKLD